MAAEAAETLLEIGGRPEVAEDSVGRAVAVVRRRRTEREAEEKCGT